MRIPVLWYHNHMDLIITICARGGSKGIPGKNIKPVAGKPLLAYTIEQAKKFAGKHSGDVVLSTESDQIRAVAAECGLETEYMRPSALGGDTISKEAVMRDVMEYHEKKLGKRYDMLLDLDVTSPLRTTEDLETGLMMMEQQPQALDLFSVNSAARNPYFNMVEQGKDGFYHLSKQPETPIVARQLAPEVYDLNASFYYYRREFFEGGWKTPFTDRAIVYVMPHMCFDLDTPLDYEILDYLIEHGRLDFDFGS